ncbi:hypothetical protein [Nonomuraea basaltis]|uniref:hypothetical protein n=1 Tax=Nonomuraea basaltis TaxID=2495887 RepID=UPI00110C547C|nr:hypothetical protein [Nonomuraea basaltis]TMR95455.1 hypothetical protein EJK15_28525 [Nonomuraea basaltis]
MVTISAMALGGTVLSWGSRGMTGKAARADVSPLALTEWTTCRVDYAPDADTGGAYYGLAAACNGGSYRASTFCRSGWHRTDAEAAGPTTKDYSAVSNRCWSTSDGRNAWRWAAGGYTYRCSDGKMKVCASGGCTTYNTVCRYRV